MSRVTLIAQFCAAFVSRALAQPAETTGQQPRKLGRVRGNGIESHYFERGKGIPLIFVRRGLG